jgi:hypothetical protein
MEEAGGLYRALGFRTTEPYRYNPLPDVVYLRLDLPRSINGGDPWKTS